MEQILTLELLSEHAQAFNIYNTNIQICKYYNRRTYLSQIQQALSFALSLQYYHSQLNNKIILIIILFLSYLHQNIYIIYIRKMSKDCFCYPQKSILKFTSTRKSQHCQFVAVCPSVRLSNHQQFIDHNEAISNHRHSLKTNNSKKSLKRNHNQTHPIIDEGLINKQLLRPSTIYQSTSFDKFDLSTHYFKQLQLPLQKVDQVEDNQQLPNLPQISLHFEQIKGIQDIKNNLVISLNKDVLTDEKKITIEKLPIEQLMIKTKKYPPQVIQKNQREEEKNNKNQNQSYNIQIERYDEYIPSCDRYNQSYYDENISSINGKNQHKLSIIQQLSSNFRSSDKSKLSLASQLKDRNQKISHPFGFSNLLQIPQDNNQPYSEQVIPIPRLSNPIKTQNHINVNDNLVRTDKFNLSNSSSCLSNNISSDQQFQLRRKERKKTVEEIPNRFQCDENSRRNVSMKCSGKNVVCLDSYMVRKVESVITSKNNNEEGQTSQVIQKAKCLYNINSETRIKIEAMAFMKKTAQSYNVQKFNGQNYGQSVYVKEKEQINQSFQSLYSSIR